MKEIIKSTCEVAIWFFTLVKPLCEEAKEHPVFSIFAVLGTAGAISLWIKKKLW